VKKYLPIAYNLLPHTSAPFLLHKFLSPTRYTRPKREQRIWAQGKVLDCGDFQARAYNYHAEKKVVFVHGWSGRGSQFYAFVEPLVVAGYAVLLVDGPAHGDSEGTKTNLVDFTRALAKALRNTNVHALVGHSFGGMSILLSAKLGLQAKKRISIGSPVYTAKVVEFFARRVGLKAHALAILKKSLEKETKMEVEEVDAHPHFSTRDCDYLIVHDTKDKQVAVDRAESLQNKYLGAQTLITEGLGHFRILSDQQVVAKIVDFIKS
tara:strand:+ start:10611 stop:11405 length:795 start_codon:yes stop_codon:yes gene_type:complete